MHNSIKKNTLKYNPQKRELNLQYFSNPNFHQNFSRIILIGWEMGESSNEKKKNDVYEVKLLYFKEILPFTFYEGIKVKQIANVLYLYLLLWVGRNISG